MFEQQTGVFKAIELLPANIDLNEKGRQDRKIIYALNCTCEHNPFASSMHNLSYAEALTASDYIAIVLEKTKQNRGLALTIFKKLFQELPQQLEGIEAALNSEDYLEAGNITHQLHGSASFCGLTSIQEQAHRLEQHLLNFHVQFVFQDFHLLQESVWLFTRYMEVILSELHSESR